jgi:excisionase family DNA binding protein
MYIEHQLEHQLDISLCSILVNGMVSNMTEQTQITGERAFRVLDARWDGRSTLSVEEAGCDVLGLSRASAYAAAKKGSLPVIRIGHRMVVPRYALEKLLMGGAA